MEFASDGRFEDRRSVVASGDWQDQGFQEVRKEGEWTILRTGGLEIRTRQDDLPFDRTNLEIRWLARGFVQFWRPGDRDYQNLGGPLRSLEAVS